MANNRTVPRSSHTCLAAGRRVLRRRHRWRGTKAGLCLSRSSRLPWRYPQMNRGLRRGLPGLKHRWQRRCLSHPSPRFRRWRLLHPSRTRRQIQWLHQNQRNHQLRAVPSLAAHLGWLGVRRQHQTPWRRIRSLPPRLSGQPSRRAHRLCRLFLPWGRCCWNTPQGRSLRRPDESKTSS